MKAPNLKERVFCLGLGLSGHRAPYARRGHSQPSARSELTWMELFQVEIWCLSQAQIDIGCSPSKWPMMAQGAWQQTPRPSPSEGTLDDGSPAGAETLAPLPRLTQQAQQSHRAHTPGCSRWCLGAIAFCSLAEWQAERAGPAWRPLRLNRAWCPLGRGATMLVESRMAPQRGREDS